MRVRRQVADALTVPFHEVDAHNVVPCWVASDKRETGARTIRRKINDKLPVFLEVRLQVSPQCLMYATFDMREGLGHPIIPHGMLRVAYPCDVL